MKANMAYESMTQKLEALQGGLKKLERVVVAFSGGVDSALLAWVANDSLGRAAHAVTAVSASLPAEERESCKSLAEDWGLRWSEVFTREQQSESYRRNDTQRCAHCRDALMDALTPLAREDEAAVVLGITASDLGDHRPGIEASRERGASFPLLEAGFTKDDVRALSRSLGLPTWSKPAAPCLASRIPYGTPVSVEVLSRIERAEAALGKLGFADRRVRHYGDVARVEVPQERLGDLLASRSEVVRAVKAAGYRYVTVDLEGLRSGNLNTGIDSQT